MWMWIGHPSSIQKMSGVQFNSGSRNQQDHHITCKVCPYVHSVSQRTHFSAFENSEVNNYFTARHKENTSYKTEQSTPHRHRQWGTSKFHHSSSISMSFRRTNNASHLALWCIIPIGQLTSHSGDDLLDELSILVVPDETMRRTIWLCGNVIVDSACLIRVGESLISNPVRCNGYDSFLCLQHRVMDLQVVGGMSKI